MAFDVVLLLQLFSVMNVFCRLLSLNLSRFYQGKNKFRLLKAVNLLIWEANDVNPVSVKLLLLNKLSIVREIIELKKFVADLIAKVLMKNFNAIHWNLVYHSE